VLFAGFRRRRLQHNADLQAQGAEIACGHRSLTRFYAGLYDREPEAAAPRRPRAVRFEAIKRIKQAKERLGRHTRALIRDAESDFIVLWLRSNAQCAIPGVTRGVARTGLAPPGSKARKRTPAQ